MIQPIDKTCRYPVGKVLIEIQDLEKFEWYGDNQNLYIRVSSHPYVLFSRRISKKPKEQKICEFNEITNEREFRNIYSQRYRQLMLVPIHNYFGSITIEVVNQINKGWFTDHQQEHVLAKFNIKIPDIKKLYEDCNSAEEGLLRLPLDEVLDLKKFGLKPFPT